MPLSGKCPICGQGPLEPVLNDIYIQALVRGESRPIGGLKAYKCTENGHIFFVQLKDVNGQLEKS